jgi:metal-dependent hydrolase (beta-lactamase superfamily II)
MTGVRAKGILWALAVVLYLISAEFRQLGVRQISPCHCAGDRARGWFAQAFCDDCILAGAGQVTEL